MFSGFLVRAQQWRVFASAHSRGLRRDFYASTDNADRFATAHSCGLRRRITSSYASLPSLPQRIRAGCDSFIQRFKFAVGLCHSAFVRVATIQPWECGYPCWLCHSAFVRVATTSRMTAKSRATLCHSAFVRVATTDNDSKEKGGNFATAHSRGLRHCKLAVNVAGRRLCHSAFARVATRADRVRPELCQLCHSAFARVATRSIGTVQVLPLFATAHSCGLRRFIEAVGKHINPLPQRIRAGCDGKYRISLHNQNPLPQRIRAGCDCGKAMQRTANLLREGR